VTAVTAITQADAARALALALVSDAPSREHTEELMLYGQFVGEWEFDWIGYEDTGEAALRERGEWIFAWTLEGRAVQDVWIVPERERRGREGVPEGEYGTTIRFYDPRANVWHVTWSGPIQGGRRTFLARRAGDEIVQEGETDEGQPLRWVFSEISDRSFRWRSMSSQDGGRTWQLREEMHVRRKSAA
jgi:hypothetical protein